MEKVEDKIRDTLVEALKSYFKSDLAGNEDVQDESEHVQDEKAAEKYTEPDIENKPETSGNSPSDVHANENTPEEMENEYDNLDLSNLFLFPETNAPHKSRSFSFNIGMDTPKPGFKMTEEIDPKIFDDFMNFMAMLGVTPDDIADTLEEMSNFGMPPKDNETLSPKKKFEVQPELFHDIFEEESHLSVIAELPGIEKKDIELHVAQKEIELNGNIINLPALIDPDQVKAKLNNGILEITLQKIHG